MRTPRRIYVAFGEHPAAGVCVCVCSSKLLFVCVCLIVCSFVSLFVSLVGWLFVSMCACLFFATLQHNFVPQSHFGVPFYVFVALWETLGPHCNTWGYILTPWYTFSVFLPPLWVILFAMVFACFLAPPGSPDSRPREGSGRFGGRGGHPLLLFNKAHSESSLYHRARSAPGLLPTA